MPACNFLPLLMESSNKEQSQKFGAEELIRSIALMASATQTDASYFTDDVLARAKKYSKYIKTGL